MRARLHRQLPPVAIALLLGATAIGCEESPTTPDEGPVGGGEEFVLDAEQYALAVAPVMAARGCDAGGECHGGGIRGTFQLSPPENKNVTFDFEQAVLQVNGYDPTQSHLLTEPLDVDAGGTTHPFTTFDTTSDPGYQAILSWIEAGEFR